MSILPWDYYLRPRLREGARRFPMSSALDMAVQAAWATGIGSVALLPHAEAFFLKPSMEKEGEPVAFDSVTIRRVDGYGGQTEFAFADQESQDRYILWFYDIDPKKYV